MSKFSKQLLELVDKTFKATVFLQENDPIQNRSFKKTPHTILLEMKRVEKGKYAG